MMHWRSSSREGLRDGTVRTIHESKIERECKVHGRFVDGYCEWADEKHAWEFTCFYHDCPKCFDLNAENKNNWHWKWATFTGTPCARSSSYEMQDTSSTFRGSTSGIWSTENPKLKIGLNICQNGSQSLSIWEIPFTGEERMDVNSCFKLKERKKFCTTISRVCTHSSINFASIL